MSTTQQADFLPAAFGDGVDPASINPLFGALRRLAPEWSADADVVNLRPGEPVSDNGMYPGTAYFPLSCVISKLAVMGDGRAVEFATVGREGLAGAAEVLTGAPLRVRVICQVPGAAARVDRAELAAVVRDNSSARNLLERYVQTLLVQVAQIAACNRLHPVEERCARWLLMTHDRVVGDEFLLTQEFLAQMLGVRRARVNVAAGMLQRSGLISYTRGRIRIADRPALERVACECYHVIRGEYEQLASATGKRIG